MKVLDARTEQKREIKRLDDLYSEYIRLRAMVRVHGCERCLQGKTDIGQLHCAHFIPRTKKATRWDDDNAAGLCPGCHRFIDNDAQAKVEFFTKLLGQEKLDLLNARVRNRERPDKSLLEIYYTERIKRLTNTSYVTGQEFETLLRKCLKDPE